MEDFSHIKLCITQNNVLRVNKYFLHRVYIHFGCCVDEALDFILDKLSKLGITIHHDDVLKPKFSDTLRRLKERFAAKRGGRAQSTLSSLWQKSYAELPVREDVNIASSLDVHLENAALRTEVQRLRDLEAEKDAEISAAITAKHAALKKLEAVTRNKRTPKAEEYSSSHVRRMKRKLAKEASQYGLDVSISSGSAANAPKSDQISPHAVNQVMDECSVSLRTFRKMRKLIPATPSAYAIGKLRKE